MSSISSFCCSEAESVSVFDATDPTDHGTVIGVELPESVRVIEVLDASHSRKIRTCLSCHVNTKCVILAHCGLVTPYG